MQLVIYLCLIASIANCSLGINEQLNAEWQIYKRKFGKEYNSTEDAYRRSVWEKTLARIEKHNKLYDQGLSTYRKGVNQISDMSIEEFFANFGYNVVIPPRDASASSVRFLGNKDLPEYVNWNERGYVGTPIDQGNCGCCYAIAAVGALEAQYKKKTGKFIDLSVQQVVDCSVRYGNSGCEGGNGFSTVLYFYDAGLTSTNIYPYEAKNGVCREKEVEILAKAQDVHTVPENDEEALKWAVAEIGPVSVAIDAMTVAHGDYESGVLDDPDCNSKNLNHGVLVVGYGTENGTDYWLVKQSWGTYYGENGFVKMARNKKNQCGIVEIASVPLM